VRKIWLVAKATYGPRVRSGAFLMLTFGLPALMVLGGIIALLGAGGDLPRVGTVDRTGRLAPVAQVGVDGVILYLASFPDADSAQAALRQGDIGGYLLIPEGYFEGETPTYYGKSEPGPRLEQGLELFLRRALLPEADLSRIKHLSDPSERVYVVQGSGREVTEGLPMVIRFGTPALLAVMFALAIFTGASQMGTAMVREKDQRAIEMVVTSLAPWELVVGKVLGLALLTLTQVGVWTVGAATALGLGLASASGAPSLSVPWQALGWGLLLGVPGYFLYATLAAGLGIIAGDRQQARQLAGMLGFIGMAPLYFVSFVLGEPDGPIAVALTLFPLTGPMLALLRMVLTEVPAWQLVASGAIILVSLGGSVWFVARIFRAAMLMYGQSLRPRQIWRALRAS
jgi:ABC-2 type transport system permease protein